MAKTLLVTVTVFTDQTRLSYSFHNSQTDELTPVHVCNADLDAWTYLLSYLPCSYGYDDVRICVIDRSADGPRATSRCSGHSLTGKAVR